MVVYLRKSDPDLMTCYHPDSDHNLDAIWYYGYLIRKNILHDSRVQIDRNWLDTALHVRDPRKLPHSPH